MTPIFMPVIKQVSDKSLSELLETDESQAALATSTQLIAEALISVQSIDPNIMAPFFENGKDEKWLLANGYEPVDDQTRLLWRKKP